MTLWQKLLPAPLLAASLLGVWLALARSVSPGQVLLGVVFAVVFSRLTSNLRPETVRVQRPRVVVKFILTVGLDVLRSNVAIAWGVLWWHYKPARSKFVRVPLELRDPLGLAALAVVTTVIPGTVWSELALDRSMLLLHVWDVEDELSFVAGFKARYEQPLREIFE
jgi:multicomponent K+:H+ antiporter subunit E